MSNHFFIYDQVLISLVPSIFIWLKASWQKAMRKTEYRGPGIWSFVFLAVLKGRIFMLKACSFHILPHLCLLCLSLMLLKIYDISTKNLTLLTHLGKILSSLLLSQMRIYIFLTVQKVDSCHITGNRKL